jgi:hypothetical protein
MKKILLIIVACFLMHTINTSAEVMRSKIVLNFSQVYPCSPMKNLVSMSMRLWSEVKASHAGDALYEDGDTQDIHFAKEVLLLNTMLDITFMDLSKKMHECPDCVQVVLQDVTQLAGVIHEITHGYHALMSNDTAPVTATKFILDRIMMKIDKTLAMQEVPKEMYAFMKAAPHQPLYPKPTTPLFVPAMT